MEGFPVRSGVNAIPCPVCKLLEKAKVIRETYPVLLPVHPTQVARLKVSRGAEAIKGVCVRGHPTSFNIRY